MIDRIRSKISTTSLKEQLIVLFLMVSIIPLLWVSFMAYNNGKNILKDSVGQSLSQLAIEKVGRADRSILHRIEEIKSRSAMLREKVNMANQISPPEILEQRWRYEGEAITGIGHYVELLMTIAGEGGQVIITDKSGHVIGSTDNDSLDFDQSGEGWWKKAYFNDKGYDLVDDIQYLPERRMHYIPISVPIKETNAQDSNAIGVLRILFALPELKEIVNPISNNKIGRGTEVIIIDDGAVIIAASPNTDYKVFEDKVESEQGAKALTPEINGYYGYGTEDDGTEVIGRAHTQKWTDAKYRERNYANWTVLVSQPADVAFAVAKQLRNKILIFTLISCLVVVLIAWLFARKIVEPILTLTNAAKEIGRGEFDLEIPVVSSSNEVGILAEEFGLMQQNLKMAIIKLTQEEKKMTAVVNSLSEGLIVVDKRNRILHINRFAIDMLELEDISEEMTISELIQSPELLEAIEESAAQIDEDNKIGSSEVILEKEESELILKVLARPFVEENGQALGSVYVLYDKTREREIDRMKTDFVRLVSHELRTPLTSIIGFVQFILDGKAGSINDVQKKSLSRVARQSKRLSSLINDLLDISRIESGRIEMKQQALSLLSIVKQRVEEIRPQADEKKVDLSLTAPDTLPAFIGDEERIGQVVTNLIGNAIKFTPEDGRVGVRIRGGRESLLHLEVIDTGPGVPEEERQHVFDKFYQLDNVSTRTQGGSGLGLSIAKSIIESHGGRIWIDDGEGGRGSNFQFVLPAAHGSLILNAN